MNYSDLYIIMGTRYNIAVYMYVTIVNIHIKYIKYKYIK